MDTNRIKRDRFLPVSREDLAERGWDEYDFLVITGDAYVDHPTFGPAIISRLLESEGYRVAILAQPDWRKESAFTQLGRPRFGCSFPAGISTRWSPTTPWRKNAVTTTPIPRETGQRKRENPLDRSPGRRYDKEVSTAGRLGSAHTEIKHLPRVGQSSEDLISCIGEKLPGTS